MLSKNHNFSILLIGRVLQIIITLLTLRVSTTILPQIELGSVYYIIAVQSFFSLFLISPVGQYFNRQTARWFMESKLYCIYIKQLFYILTVSLFSVFFMLSASSFGLKVLPYELLLITSCLILSQSVNQTVIPMFNMLENHAEFVFFNLFTALLALIFSYIFICFYSATALAWVGGIVIGNGMVAMIASLRFRTRNINSINNKVLLDFVEIRKFCFPIAIATVFMWFLNSGYRITVEKLYGLEFLAFLGVGLAISSQIFTIAESLLTQYLIPKLFKSVENKNSNERELIVNAYFKIVIPIYVSLAMFLTFSVEYFFPFVVGTQYYDAYNFAIYGAWVELGRVLTNTLAVVSQVEKKTTKFVLPYALGAMFLFICILVNDWLQLGGEVKTLLVISSFIVLITMYLSMKSYLSFDLPLKLISYSVLLTLPAIGYFLIFSFNAQLSIENFLMCTLGGCIYFLGVAIAFRFGDRSLSHNIN